MTFSWLSSLIFVVLFIFYGSCHDLVVAGFSSVGIIISVPNVKRKSTRPLFYDSSRWQSDQRNNGHHHHHHLDVSSLEKNAQEQLIDWLDSLKQVERSEPEWVGNNLLEISCSSLIQEHLQSMLPQAPSLFPTEWSRAKFDFDWRCCLLRSISSSELEDVLYYGQSNTHPLRLQLVAIPSNTSLPLHVHPAFELDIPLVGSFAERRSNILLSKDMLCRQPEHCIGTPISDFSSKPTHSELQIIGRDLSRRVELDDHGEEGGFETQELSQGDCLVNDVGSVHQSFTMESSPSLLWVLGPNVHAHFQPGNFRQRQGIQDLEGIHNLLLLDDDANEEK